MKEIAKKELNPLQKKKLETAAKIFIATARLYQGVKDKSLLPLWAAGVVTHGQPKGNKFIVGITNSASKAVKENNTKLTTLDHLFRVTQTAKFILNKINTNNISCADVEQILLDRSIYMRTTREENSGVLKAAIKNLPAAQQDDWKALYTEAGIEYKLC